MNARGECKLAFRNVDELYEYNNSGATESYIGSSVSDINDNIERARKKTAMIFSSNFDCRKVNRLIYVKFWRQACISSLLFGTELMSITPSLYRKLELFQSWFLKNVCFEPDYAPSILLLKLSGLNSIESQVHVKRLLLLGRLITEPKIAPAV